MELTTHRTDLMLQRSEIVAFVNTLHRLSESLAAIDRFRRLWAERDAAGPAPAPAPAPLPAAPASESAPAKPSFAFTFNPRQFHPAVDRTDAPARRRSHFGPEGSWPAQHKARSVFVSNATATATLAEFVDGLALACRTSYDGCAAVVARLVRLVFARDAPKSEL